MINKRQWPRGQGLNQAAFTYKFRSAILVYVFKDIALFFFQVLKENVLVKWKGKLAFSF